MLKPVCLLTLAASVLTGCMNGPRVAAFRQCEHDFPRSSYASPLIVLGAIGGAAAGAMDDPNKPDRDACYQDAIVANR